MRHRSLDVVVIIIVAAVAMALARLGLNSGIVPILLGAPLVFLLPGYALTVLAARTLSIGKRMVLSIALSVLLTALGRFLLPLTPWGMHTSSWAVWLGSIALGAALGALIRDHGGFRPRPLRPAALRSLAVCSVVGAILMALVVVARTHATESASARMLQPWLVPSASPAPTTPANDVVALGRSSTAPAATITATEAPTLPLAVALASSLSTPAPVPTGTPVPAQASPPPTSNAPVAERLDIALNGWPIRETSTASMRFEADQYRLTLNGQPSVSVASVIPVRSYRLNIGVTLGQGEAGVMFLAVEPAKFYRIMFNTQGAYAIQEVQQNSAASLLVGWTPSPALQGAENIRVRIERHGDTIQFFANDQPLTTFGVPPGAATNQAGVALTAGSEQGQATFTSLVVEQLAR